MLIDLDYKEVTIQEDPNLITIELKSVSSSDYTLLVKMMKSVFDSRKDIDLDSNSGQIEMGMSQISNPLLIDVAKEVLPKNSRNLKGIQIKENNVTKEATVEDILSTGVGLTVILKILTELFTISTTQSEEANDLKKQ